MSEYQYYEFLAVDQPLDASAREALRDLSTRARISATQFVNSYQWGDFKGDPAKLMERWFDLHLYRANWGTRRLMLRLPKRFVDLPGLGRFLDHADGVTVRHAGDHVIFDIHSAEEEPDEDMWYDDEEDGSDELAALAPLRADLIGGDLRLFYLLWLRELATGTFTDDATEPLPGIGPLTGPLHAFADFFRIDPDLVTAAAERKAAGAAQASAEDVAAIISRLPPAQKDALLVRLFEADPQAGAELRLHVRERLRRDDAASQPPPRTVAALRARAEALRDERARAEAEALAAERRRKAEEAEKRHRARLLALANRGNSVWREIETEIGRRNPAGYAKACELLSDMKALAAERRTTADFETRLAAIRERHAQKGRFIERLAAGGV